MSNSRPLGRESPPITTRPVLPPKYTFLSVWSIRLMVKYFTNLVKIRGIQLSRQKFRWNFFLNIGHRPLFRVFSFFSHSNFNIEIKKSNSIGIQTRGCKMVGAGETTKLWRAPNFSETWVFGFLMGNPRPLLVFFQTNISVFGKSLKLSFRWHLASLCITLKKTLQFLQQINVPNVHPVYALGFKPQLLDHDSLPITTRPGLPSFGSFVELW